MASQIKLAGVSNKTGSRNGDGKFSGHSCMDYLVVAKRAIAFAISKNIHSLIDKKFVPPANVEYFDQPYWNTNAEIPDLQMIPVVDHLIELSFALPDAANVPARIQGTVRGSGWKSRDGTEIYENYLTVPEVGENWIARKRFEVTRKCIIDTNHKEKLICEQHTSAAERRHAINNARYAAERDYSDKMEKLSESYSRARRDYTAEKRHFEEQKSNCYELFHKFFEGSALRSVESLLTEGRFRAAWIKLEELNSPTAADRQYALSQQSQRLHTCIYNGGSMQDHIDTLERHIGISIELGVAMDDRVRASLLADSVKRGTHRKHYETTIAVWSKSSDATYDILKTHLGADYDEHIENKHIKNSSRVAAAANVARTDAASAGGEIGARSKKKAKGVDGKAIKVTTADEEVR
jgi:hypothetical protein